METVFIEATQRAQVFNWGKFMVGRFTEEEWARRVRMVDDMGSLLRRVGWEGNSILVLDLQTGEGAIFRPGGLASADLRKHQVWVCPMFEPFLGWLYQQDLTDLQKLPGRVELETETAALYGYRRPGPKRQRGKPATGK